jgi:hypothetical protein
MPIVRRSTPIAHRINYRRRPYPRAGIARSGEAGLGDINTVAQTIQQVEGWTPGSVSQRNNNPGNLKCAGQPGLVGCDSSNFAIFPDYATGYQALENQISLDASRGLTIAQFTQKYAPASDANNPSSYAATIANAAGVTVNDPLSAALDLSGADAGGGVYTAGGPYDLSSLADTTDTSGTDNTPLYIGGAVLAVVALLALLA